jgi:BASS family bile acid:Na+ symporter
MTLQQLVILALQSSIVCIVFGFGLRSTTADVLFLWRRPGLLLRSLVALLVVMPILAVTISRWFDFRNTVEIVLVAVAISPVPPLLPKKEVKAGGHQPYAVSLLATLGLLAIVTIPLSVQLLAALYRQPLEMAPSRVARIALVSVLVPLIAGIAVRRWTKAAHSLARPAMLLGTLLLVMGALALLAGAWRGVWAAVGDGTVLLVVIFVVLGLGVGHALGGPEPDQSAVLGLSTACRHPAIALSIASANFPDERFGGTVLLYLLVSALVSVPYVVWSRRRHATVPAAA